MRRMVDTNTHLAIDAEWVGQPLSLGEGHAQVALTTHARMAADARGLATLRVVSVPFAELLGRLAAGDFDVAITSMSGGPDVDLWSRFASTAPADQAWSGLRDPVLDELLVAARTAMTDADRIRAARAIHRRLHQLQPLAFIAVDTRAGLASARVGGLAGHRGPPPVRGLWIAR
jgi:ABC-type transport system substrate-binding protein